MQLLSRPRRPRRCGEWTAAKAVTFIVTLAATHSVTLAARAAGMSRKSAYALKARDPAFAASWAAAAAAGSRAARQGNKVEEVEGARVPSRQGYKRARLLRPRFPKSPRRLFEELAAELRDSPMLARRAAAQ